MNRITKFLQILFYPFCLLYQIVFFLDQKFTKPKKLQNSFVISVGNLSVGGTGKTPFTIYLANTIHKLYPEKEIVILSRGYGGKKSSQGMLVLEDSNPEDTGDEPLLLKRALPFATVIIGKDRYSSFLEFHKLTGSKTIVILDDGFQHHRLQRDFDFVLIDSQKKFGNGFTLPVGMLREKPSALQRANSVVFTKTKFLASEEFDAFKKSVLRLNPKLNPYIFSYHPNSLENAKARKSIAEINGKKVFVFTGIGNPEYFLKTIESQNPLRIQYRFFQDHHEYTIQELTSLIEESKECDLLICTEKDYVKIEKFELHGQFEKIYYVVLSTEMTDTFSFEKELKKLI